jgi:predicted transcriptional regulator
MTNLRNELISAMEQTGTTQRKLALYLEIRPATISDYLRGKTRWNVDDYERAMNYLQEIKQIMELVVKAC